MKSTYDAALCAQQTDEPVPDRGQPNIRCVLVAPEDISTDVPDAVSLLSRETIACLKASISEIG